MPTFAQMLVDTASAVAEFGADAAAYEALTDDKLLELASALAAHERAFGLIKAQHAAQVARRSRREFGHQGLAARNGFASPQKFLQQVANVTAREAVQLLSVGSAIGEADAVRELVDSGVTELAGAPVELPWDYPMSQAVAAGELSIDGADALRRGLGKPNETISGRELSDIAERLLEVRPQLGPDQLFRTARVERELLDLDGIPTRQQEQYERGGLKFFAQPDGMWRLSGQVDPESAAILTTALDPYTSPRRGGPRFTRAEDIARAQAIIDDPRTTERLALDGLVELVTLGVGVDPTRIQPKLRTLVKIVTTVDTACAVGGAREGGGDGGGGRGGVGEWGSRGDRGNGISAPTSRLHGFGVVESNGELVSAEAVRHALCDGDAVEITVDPQGNPLDLGRTSRLYDRRQREALAVRDGGCLWPACDRPPAFTEAHHTKQWKRDRGKTNIDDGVLLCRFHHLQLHTNHWEIERRETGFWLTPPRIVDPMQEAILLNTKSPIIEHLRRSSTG